MLFALFMVSILILSCANGWISCFKDWSLKDWRFMEQSSVLDKRIAFLITESQICKPPNKCQNPRPLFVGTITGGISVTLYDITDAPLIEKITAECVNTFFKLGGRASIRLRIYKMPKGEMVETKESNFPFWKYGKPYITLDLEGTE